MQSCFQPPGVVSMLVVYFANLYLRILANTEAREAVHVARFPRPSDRRVDGLDRANRMPFANKSMTFL
jgi:hypothetical protein